MYYMHDYMDSMYAPTLMEKKQQIEDLDTLSVAILSICCTVPSISVLFVRFVYLVYE